MKTVIDNDGVTLDELSEIWDDIRENYETSDNTAYDRAVLDCAARLASDPGGESAYVWALGLAVMAPPTRAEDRRRLRPLQSCRVSGTAVGNRLSGRVTFHAVMTGWPCSLPSRDTAPVASWKSVPSAGVRPR